MTRPDGPLVCPWCHEKIGHVTRGELRMVLRTRHGVRQAVAPSKIKCDHCGGWWYAAAAAVDRAPGGPITLELGELYREAVEGGRDPQLGFDLGGRILYLNPAAARLYTPEEAAILAAALLAPGGTGQGTPHVLLIDQLRAHVEIADVEALHVREDGGLVRVALTISPLTDPAGRLIGAGVIARPLAPYDDED